MLPRTSVAPLRTLSADPPLRSSRTTTRCPASSRWSATWDPMNPAPPVTRLVGAPVALAGIMPQAPAYGACTRRAIAFNIDILIREVIMRRARTASDASAQGPLSPVEFHILLSIADGERHGYAILQDVAERTCGQIRLRTGTLYTVIKRMLDGTWIEEADVRARGDDERRRYYRLT